jgi:hypothetical protein
MDKQHDIFLKSEEEIILSQIAELQKDLEAVKRLRSKYSHGNNTPTLSSPQSNIATIEIDTTNNGEPIEIPASYDKNVLTWEQRCIFLLNELGKATVEDLISKLKEYQPDVPDKTAKNVVTNKLSKLNRTHKIRADKSGKKYVYYI